MARKDRSALNHDKALEELRQYISEHSQSAFHNSGNYYFRGTWLRPALLDYLELEEGLITRVGRLGYVESTGVNVPKHLIGHSNRSSIYFTISSELVI